MRCKFCGLETKTSICEYCGYDNVHGDGYNAETVTGQNYKEPTLNKTNYGSESTAEHAAHAAYEEPELYYGDVVESSSFRDPDRSDYNYSADSDYTTRINETIDNARQNTGGFQFHWYIFLPLLMIWSPLAFLYLFATIIFPKKH